VARVTTRDTADDTPEDTAEDTAEDTPDGGADDAADLSDLADRWRADLAAWAIPEDILAQAPASPWIHPVSMFTVGDDEPDTLSHQRARAALGPGGSVLDVGSGGGRASMALVPPAGSLIAVDHSPAMLTEYAAAAHRRGVPARTVLGQWPAVADDVPVVDVVVCHHVVYNVADIVPFLRALDAHAGSRVVVELPARHPLTWLDPLWRRFWGIARPTRPTDADLLRIALALGFDAHLDRWVDQTWASRVARTDLEPVADVRTRLCLPADRDDDVAAALRDLPEPATREVATLWWDVVRE